MGQCASKSVVNKRVVDFFVTAEFNCPLFYLSEKESVSHPPQRSSKPRPQNSKFLSARAAFLVLTLVAVALATSKAPTARIVINVPASFVRNGSKIFFNKGFHGRLLLSEALKVRKQEFQQFGRHQ